MFALAFESKQKQVLTTLRPPCKWPIQTAHPGHGACEGGLNWSGEHWDLLPVPADIYMAWERKSCPGTFNSPLERTETELLWQSLKRWSVHTQATCVKSTAFHLEHGASLENNIHWGPTHRAPHCTEGEGWGCRRLAFPEPPILGKVSPRLRKREWNTPFEFPLNSP